MVRRSTLSFLLLFAVPACSGEVIVAGEPTEATSSSSSSSGTGGTTVTTGSTGTGIGGSGGSGGSGGAAVCGQETFDRLDVYFSEANGATIGCDAQWGEFELSARVLDTPAPGVFLLDSCSPAADCIEQLSKLSIAAPGLYTDVTKGMFVRVHGRVQGAQGNCAQQIQITNLPVWDGVPNPVQGGETIWLLGADGTTAVFPETPIVIVPEALGCYPEDPTSCTPHDDYTWYFGSAFASEAPGVVVSMGQTAYWDVNLPSGYQSFAVRNLRSFSSGYCDGPMDFAYWMTHQYQLD